MILTRKDYREIERLEALATAARERLLSSLTPAEVNLASQALATCQLEISRIYTYYS